MPSEMRLEWSDNETFKPIKLTSEQKDWLLSEIRSGLMQVNIDFGICVSWQYYTWNTKRSSIIPIDKSM